MAPKDYGTPADNVMTALGNRGVFSFAGDDRLDLTATKWWGQIHAWAGAGDDLLNLGFHDIHDFTDTDGIYRTISHGHHVRGEAGADRFNFTDLDEVQGTVVGRIEDFNASEDRIQIDGADIDLTDLPGNVRLVAYNGDFDDPDADPQQWLLITTAAGRVFYALEGARVDMDGTGGANGGAQEAHFLTQPIDWDALEDIPFTDPQNYVPAGMTPGAGGVRINDTDQDAADVAQQITGTAQDDLIAAGLNDDVVRAWAGDDHVWGGSGHDDLYGDGGADVLEGNAGDDRAYGGDGADEVSGGAGNDRLYGNAGADTLYGDDGADRVDGGSGDDRVHGGAGDDYLYGQGGADILYGGRHDDVLRGDGGDDALYGQNGIDRLFGSEGDDMLSGGSGADILQGGTGRDSAHGGRGADVFVFDTGDLIRWGDLSGEWQERSLLIDVIEDFAIGQDVIDLRGFAGVGSRDDLKCWMTELDGNRFFTLKVDATNERLLVEVEDTVEWRDFFVDDSFLF
ncbi:calcium-binding protein [Aliishimia ponticola]|uniref:Calcium-binding protein n=1 Tax=Aliishimia ponticola TaxID=2499833 RepID=A0A4S4N935_9RHOB|nr:calcium-binding protein [Aliishimia ponticola]THH35754.1 calcium-binding protein [Aliishimia ponticola]